MRLLGQRRVLVVLIGAAVVLIGGAATILAVVDDDEDGYTREAVAGACPGLNQATVSGHSELSTDLPGWQATSQQALSAGLPEVLPLASAAAFQPAGGTGTASAADTSSPEFVTYEMRSPTGGLLARVDIAYAEGKGYALRNWQACAYLTGGPDGGPSNYSYDPDDATDE